MLTLSEHPLYSGFISLSHSSPKFSASLYFVGTRLAKGLVAMKSTNMTLIRFQPQSADLSPALQPGDLLRDYLDLHFPFFPQGKVGTNPWSPALDLYDDKDAFTVTLEAPGLSKEDFEISWHDGVLSIAGERRAEPQPAGQTCFRRERLHGRFARSVSVPAEVQSDRISATYQDGVLHVTLPKAEQAKPKQIAVDVP
jgi:HSP20 family protein